MSGTTSTAVENDRIKLTATWLNTIASGCVVVGAVTPIAAVLYGFSAPRATPWLAALYGAMFAAVGTALHLRARKLLGGLKP